MILIGFNVCRDNAKVKLYVLNNAFWGCGGCNLKIMSVLHIELALASKHLTISAQPE